MNVVHTAGVVTGHNGLELGYAVLVCDLHTPECHVFDVFLVTRIHEVYDAAVCPLIQSISAKLPGFSTVELTVALADQISIACSLNGVHVVMSTT